jgi:hypothetical protein
MAHAQARALFLSSAAHQPDFFIIASSSSLIIRYILLLEACMGDVLALPFCSLDEKGSATEKLYCYKNMVALYHYRHGERASLTNGIGDI